VSGDERQSGGKPEIVFGQAAAAGDERIPDDE